MQAPLGSGDIAQLVELCSCNWVVAITGFFKINELSNGKKVKVAVVSFAQDEVNWFCWSNNRTKLVSWDDLKQRMFKHFQLTGEGSLEARLIRIQQDAAKHPSLFSSAAEPQSQPSRRRASSRARRIVQADLRSRASVGAAVSRTPKPSRSRLRASAANPSASRVAPLRSDASAAETPVGSRRRAKPR
ncbi:retrotransposon protein [Cucumis melo var. makuwa]|uniref:Retrotransposon protein n=1 Tax=Cucumis melo var. makuwa TaxID=1194695 RepID=A0A5A7U310_CUCMM|nr:retrotransposon protein [Cucumis melo var. makuwa]